MSECRVVESRKGRIVKNPKEKFFHIVIRDERTCEAYENDEDHICDTEATLDRQYKRPTLEEAQALLKQKLSEPPNLDSGNPNQC